MAKIAVIGAGVMGLASAYDLLRAGHTVDIFEADDRIGGMSAHFDFGGLSIERYYHFVCKPDQHLFKLLEELQISHELDWRPTRMGYYHQGKLHDWGNPFALLRFPGLDLISKFRYGLHMFWSTKRSRWEDLDAAEASEWIKGWIGNKAYDVLWRRLFELKFHDYTGNLSAAWIWARIKRVGTSRRNLLQEELGFIRGGSERLLQEIEAAIKGLGGNIHLNAPVERVNWQDEKIKGVTVNGETIGYDVVISTIPLPFVPRILPDLPEETLEKYRNVQNIGVVCVIFKLQRQVTENFWLNVSDPEMDIPGIIEYSNLRPLDNNIVYVPYYMPQSHPKYQWSNERIIDEASDYIKRINPELKDSDIVDARASRYGFAQPICQPEFLSQLPPIKTPVNGLFVADTSYYYPEDRSISESVRIGREIAEMISAP
jgi:protoporphyrinogen oxidase